jgi:hypothetical protein
MKRRRADWVDNDGNDFTIDELQLLAAREQLESEGLDVKEVLRLDIPLKRAVWSNTWIPGPDTLDAPNAALMAIVALVRSPAALTADIRHLKVYVRFLAQIGLFPQMRDPETCRRVCGCSDWGDVFWELPAFALLGPAQFPLYVATKHIIPVFASSSKMLRCIFNASNDNVARVDMLSEWFEHIFRHDMGSLLWMAVAEALTRDVPQTSVAAALATRIIEQGIHLNGEMGGLEPLTMSVASTHVFSADDHSSISFSTWTITGTTTRLQVQMDYFLHVHKMLRVAHARHHVRWRGICDWLDTRTFLPPELANLVLQYAVPPALFNDGVLEALETPHVEGLTTELNALSSRLVPSSSSSSA